MQQVQNLWPSSLGNIEVSAPVHILAKQAEYFNGMMQNVLTATVTTFADSRTNEFSHILKIKAPFLGNFFLNILTVTHNAIRPYPLILSNSLIGKNEPPITTEKMLVEVLKDIFNSSELNEAISALIAQSKFLREGEDLPF